MSGPFAPASAPVDLSCAGKTTKMHDISMLILAHTTQMVTIEITTNLDQVATDEAWGISTVEVIPFVLSVGKGEGPLPADGVIDFAAADGLDPFGGIGLQLETCPDGGYLSVTGPGDQNPEVSARGADVLPFHSE